MCSILSVYVFYVISVFKHAGVLKYYMKPSAKFFFISIALTVLSSITTDAAYTHV